jgi:hypothetical protein
LIHPLVFKLTIWFVAIFANLTALQRIRNAYKQDAARSDREPMAEP